MALELVVQESYRWVLTAAFANVVLTTWMATRVGAARRRYKVPLPTMYANKKEHKDAKVFNCVQRAHQNTLEYLPSMITVLLLGGLQYPLVAAALGASYFAARVQYWRGYTAGDANKRFAAGGVLIFPTFFGLWICTICLLLHLFFPHLV